MPYVTYYIFFRRQTMRAAKETSNAKTNVEYLN